MLAPWLPVASQHGKRVKSVRGVIPRQPLTTSRPYPAVFGTVRSSGGSSSKTNVREYPLSCASRPRECVREENPSAPAAGASISTFRAEAVPAKRAEYLRPRRARRTVIRTIDFLRRKPSARMAKNVGDNLFKLRDARAKKFQPGNGWSASSAASGNCFAKTT